MSPRSEEFMDQARGRVEAERIVAGAADYVAAVRVEVAAMDRIPTLDEIRKITSKDPSSWAETIIVEREERF